MSKRALILATGVGMALLVGLSACGQKGPLYLPGNAPAKRAPPQEPAASQPSTATPR
ncbi:LPS translocon maturation chaperone LptM [Caldimonas mangrovi]|uniref:LPS translocon maturation chaperone LptM n=1 Tax=Caldimonas mangrovi TaxID=2944811 RepID=UPI00387ED848